MAVVVITGASSGIGEATAIHLAELGHKLVLAARRVDRLHALAERLSDRTEVLVVPTDVASPQSLEELARLTFERFGAVDVWVNNAGVGGGSNWLDQPASEIEQVIAINLTAPILGARAALPYMRQAGRGHIINVSSVAGHIGTHGLYSATKFGLRGHSEALGRALAGQGIQVSLVSPGFVRTEMTQHRSFRMPGPEVVARAIAGVIRRPRREVVVPWYYRVGIVLNTLAPWLTDLALRSRARG